MSDFTGLAVISFFGVTGFLANYYVSNSANELAAQIVTGTMRGAPISIGTRRALLFQGWFSYQAFAIGMNVFAALAAIQFADHVDDSKVKLLARFLVLFPATASLSYLNNAIFGVRNMGRALRRMEHE